MSYTETFYIGDVEFEVEFSSTPYVPAKISGPPEHCHPAEGGEVEIESICIGEFEVSDVISETVRDKLQKMAEEAAPELEADERDCAMAEAADAAEARAMDREASWDY